MTEEELWVKIGWTLDVLGLIILIINAVLLNMPDKDLGLITILLVVAICMIATGKILRYSPPQETKK